jgi:DNA invertase Pin-like site-specific DNA recombinase
VSQVENGETLAVQAEQLRAICVLNRLELAGIHAEEAVSGGTAFRQRPEGGKLWAALEPGDFIISTRLDRASRSAEDALATLEACRKRGVGLILLDLGHQDLTDGAVQKLVLSLIASVASFERDRCGERIRSVKSSQRARGRFLGGSPPFAHLIVERNGERFIEPDTELQARVLDLHRQDHSARQVCWALAREGHRVGYAAVCRFLRPHAKAA